MVNSIRMDYQFVPIVAMDFIVTKIGIKKKRKYNIKMERKLYHIIIANESKYRKEKKRIFQNAY